MPTSKRTHESTLIWNELFILWFLDISLLQGLPSRANWKVHGWLWHRINRNQGFLLGLRVCAQLCGESRSHSESTDFLLLLQAILNIKSYLWLEVSLFSASLFSPEAKHIRTRLSGQLTSPKKVNLLRCGVARGPLSALIPCTPFVLEVQSATSLALFVLCFAHLKHTASGPEKPQE